MAMMARGLGPVRNVSVRRCQLGGARGARALLLPELRAVDSMSGPVVNEASQHRRNAAGGTTRPYSALVGGSSPATTRDDPSNTSGCFLTRTSVSVRRSMGSSGFDDRATPPPASSVGLNSKKRATAALLLCGSRGHHSRRIGVCSARASREWRSGGGDGVPLLQFAGLQSSARVLGPTGEEDRKTHGGQQEAADEGKTVKGGNPACQKRGDDGGGFVQMRERIRQGRLDASEDARDWMRDKRDDMNTMKETLRDTRQELRDARRDGRLGEELSEQAKESSGRLQVLWRQYGAVGIGTYFGIYFGSIAFFYVVYDYGVLTNLPSGGTAVIEHMQEWMKNAPDWARSYSDRLFGAMVEDHRARSLVLAWATCKVIEPLRLLGAIAITPRMARALGRAPSKVADDDDDDDDADGNCDDGSALGKDGGKGFGIEDADSGRDVGSGGGDGGGRSSSGSKGEGGR